ncbi:UDP-N-acetylglucosamine 2-epimerase (hydrolyzing) [Candidatus Heimdallarchaeota archaeon B3_Heim]|nr:MAG: UDP-N-acetylglucosamine 2-epimerase (hydrolyzing) [Candidatus Heimdallarchaeota archaeon B3_Heim]
MEKGLELRKVAVITGTRAEYGLLKPVIQKIIEDSDLELDLIVTGTHLSEEFGYTINDIVQDKIPVTAKIKAYPLTDDGYAMAKAISRLLDKLIDELAQNRPDFILILGDRGEPLAAAIAGTYSNIPVAHIHGGEVSGSVDEPVRHAISKLAHIHLPATQSAAERLIKMGESENRVFITGAPGLDSILHENFLTRDALAEKIGLDPSKNFIVVLQHAVTTKYTPKESADQIKITLQAVARLNSQNVVIYPNSDAGGREMIQEIEKIAKEPNFHVFKNLPSMLYRSLLKHATLLIGNSSSGIIEAPSYNLPVINIGSRQNKRERAGNVITVDYDEQEIYDLATRILTDQKFRQSLEDVINPYGDGTAAEKIVEVLTAVEITPEFLQKTMTYSFHFLVF